MRSTLFLLLFLCSSYLGAQVQFIEKAEDSGIIYQGRSYGSSWGDINNDGFMDLFMSCHQHMSEPVFDNDSLRLFLNLANGNFSENVYDLDDGNQSDIHAGAFFDYDNDGDKDLIVLTGGTKRNLFYINDGIPSLIDTAEFMNADLPLGRGRQTTCVDVDRNGITDLIINNEEPREIGQPGSALLLRMSGENFIQNTSLGYHEPHSDCSLISDINGDNSTDIITVNNDSLKIFSLGLDGTFQLEKLILTSEVRDIAVADFNGDLLPDIFMAIGKKTDTDIGLFNNHVIHSMSRISANRPPVGCDFNTAANSEVIFRPVSPIFYTIHLGSSFVSDPIQGIQSIPLDSNDPNLQGVQSLDSGLSGVHIYIGIETDGSYHIELMNFDEQGTTMGLEMITEEVITDFQTFGFTGPDANSSNIMLFNQGDFEFAASTSSAFNIPEYSLNVSYGDYDNDMDLDIYTVCTGQALNRPDYIYENLGNGDFIAHENDWGIQGDSPGIGDAVSTVDYNNDGFLDLFVVNGALTYYLDSAKVKLYENQGNNNHWLKIIPEGTFSNRDGFGVRAIVTSGGVSQSRDMNGGIHTATQDDARLHFGLGQNELVESIFIYWPSGIIDGLYNVTVDQIMTIVEGEHPLSISDFQTHGPRIYPSPWTGGNITIELGDQAPSVMFIYSIHGALIGSINIVPDQVSYSMPDLSPGAYLFQFQDSRGKVLGAQQFIKQ